jgi:excisionase family DNA binding protein
MANRSPQKITLPRSAFSAQELAERWGMTRQFIYNQINLGRLKSFKAGRSRLIPLTEIERIERGGTG